MIAKEIEDYSRQHRLIGENLFEDWRASWIFSMKKAAQSKPSCFMNVRTADTNRRGS